MELVPHANGTHTECVGHALPGHVTLADIPLPAPVLPAVLLTVDPPELGGSGDEYGPGVPDDRVVSRAALAAAAAALVTAAAGGGAAVSDDDVAAFLRGGAVVVRTLPNDDSKRSRQWSGTNAPYFTPAAMRWLLEAGVAHVLCDLPSVDREDDGGHLLAHRAWWGLPPRGSAPSPLAGVTADGGGLCPRTVTELAYVPPALPDGLYLLCLHVAPIDLDAAPSRPLLFPAVRAAAGGGGRASAAT